MSDAKEKRAYPSGEKSLSSLAQLKNKRLRSLRRGSLKEGSVFLKWIYFLLDLRRYLVAPIPASGVGVGLGGGVLGGGGVFFFCGVGCGVFVLGGGGFFCGGGGFGWLRGKKPRSLTRSVK